MKNGDRVHWISCIGKKRLGYYVTAMKASPRFVLVRGDDGKAHVMLAQKPERVTGDE